MTAFVQLTFQLSPLAVTVTENPGSSTDTLENIAPSAHARSSAVFIGFLHKVSTPPPTTGSSCYATRILHQDMQ
jgi:hypothetical protein